MAVDRDLILRLEALAQLELSDSERILMQKDLENMIDLVNKLDEIDTTGLEPLVHLASDRSITREDEVKNQLDRKDALLNATTKDENYFLVPKVIEK